MKWLLYAGLGLGAAYVAYRLFLQKTALSPAVVAGPGSTTTYQTSGNTLSSNFMSAIAGRGFGG